MVTCKACGGVYNPIQADGTQYFHVCPPLSVPELRNAIAKGTIVLAPADAARLTAAADRDLVTPPLGGAVPQADLVLASLSVPRPKARDENLVSTAEKNAGAIKAEGAGVIPGT